MFNERLDPLFSCLNAILEGNRRIVAIVQDLRTFSQLDDGEIREVDLNEILQSALSIVQNTYGQVYFHYECKEDSILLKSSSFSSFAG